MADSKILITASLQIPQSTSSIANDLKQVSEQLNSRKALQIVCNIDVAKTQNRIQSQLNTIANNLRLNIGNISFGNTGQIQAQFNNIATTADNATKSINSAKSSLANLADKFTSPIKPVFNVEGIIDAEKTIQKVQNEFAELGKISVTGRYGNLSANDESEQLKDGLEQLRIKITAATGEVRTLTFQLDDAGESFMYLNSILQNEGISKHLQKATVEAVKLQTELDSIKASYSDTNSPKAIKNESNIKALANKYSKVQDAIKAVGNSDASTFAIMQANADKEIAKLKEMVTQFRNAEYAATSLRTKDITTIKSEQSNNLDRFISKINSSGIDYSKMAKDVGKLKEALNSAFDSNSLTEFLNMFSIADTKLKALTEEANAVKKSISQIDTSINKLNSIKNKKVFENNTDNQSVQHQITSIDNLIAKYNQLKAQLSVAQTPEAITSINAQITALESNFTQAVTDATQLQQKLKNTSEVDNLSSKIKKLTADIQSYINANTRMMNSNAGTNGNTFANQLQDMLTQLQSTSDPATYNKIANNFRVVRSQVKAMGLEGETAFGSLMANAKKFATWMGMTSIISAATRSIRDMINNVVDLDTALTNLKKVTDETDVTYDRFTAKVIQRAKELGTTVTDLVNSTADFAKLGYSINDAEILAEVASVYANVGELDISDATASLVSTMAAFNIEAKDAMNIVDKFNKVGNEFSITSSGIGDALQRSASSLKAAGNSLDESISLITAANTVVQNTDVIGTALKTVSLRLTSTSAELEQLGEDTEYACETLSDYRDLVLGLTHNKVDILDDNGQYKNTYNIIKEISAVWKELDSMEQSSLTKSLFGVRQANVGVSLIEQFSTAEQVLQSSIDASGSAMEEHSRWLESASAKAKQFTASVESLSSTIFNSDAIKMVIDTATFIVSTLDKIIQKMGSIPALITAIIAGLSIKKVNVFQIIESDIAKSGRSLAIFGKEWHDIINDIKNAEGLNKIGAIFSKKLSSDDINNLKEYNRLIKEGRNPQSAYYRTLQNSSAAAQNLAMSANGVAVSEEFLTRETKKLTLAQMSLNVALNVGIMLVIDLIIIGITKLVNKQKEAAQAAEETRKKAVENAKAYQEESDSLKDLQARYTQLISSTNDVTSIKEELSELQDELVDKYGKEAESIDLINGKYYEQIKAIQDLKKLEAEQYVSENQGAYEIAKNYLESAPKPIEISDNGKWSKKTINNWIEAGLGDNFTAITSAFNGVTDNPVIGLYINGNTPEEQYENLKKMAAIYAAQEGHHSSRLKLLEEQAALLREQIDEYNTIIDQMDTQRSYLKDINELYEYPLSYNDFKFNEGLKKVQESYDKYLNAETPAEKVFAAYEFEDLRDELQKLAGDNVSLQNIVDDVFSNFSIDIDTVSSSVSALNDEFSKMLDGSFKDTSDNVGKIKEALQSLAEGSYINHDDAWDIFELDTDNILNNISLINGEYDLSAKELIKLKDSLINKQKEQLEADNAEAQSAIEVANIRLTAAQEELKIKEEQHLLDVGSDPMLDQYRQNISDIEEEISGYERLISKNKFLIKELNYNLGNTVTLTDVIKNNIEKMNDAVSQLKEQADNLLKAQENKIDGIINNLNDEKDVLESQKDAMEEQLDVLEKQQQEIEDIIKNYESVADIVGNAIQDEIDSIEDSKQGIENYYDNIINKIKSANEERQDSIDLANKLAALENAKNNKVKTYKQGAGWVYSVDKEAMNNAREDLLSAKRESEISSIEKEKELAVKSYDDQIEALKAYAEQWTDISKELTDAENNSLAEQILGVEWREKIKSQDTDILNKYRNNYMSYKSQLDNLVNGEMTSLKKSIEIKQSEIDEKEKQIDVWNKYKETLQNSVKEIENSMNSYSESMKNISLNEQSSYEERITNLKDFYDNYTEYMDKIAEKNTEIAIGETKIKVIELAKDVQEKMRSFFTGGVFANGGVHTQTGFAWMDGTPSSTEVTFNASDGKKLYDLIHNTSNLSSLLGDKIAENLKLDGKNNYQPSNSASTNITNNEWKFGDIISNSPEDFMRQMNNYLRNVSGISKVNN